MELGCWLKGHSFRPEDPINCKDYRCARCGLSIGTPTLVEPTRAQSN